MRVYYNEIDKKKCAALKALMEDGHISKGDIDDRSIKDVTGSDVKGYDRCHFFAGIGLWDYALTLALWPDDRPVWTGSCPCQPWSTAGKKTAQSDERHLWPDWARLIRQSEPTEILGEQVASAIAAGWLDDALYDLEEENYSCAAAVLPACSVNSPQIRNRIWFVANADDKRKSQQEGIVQVIGERSGDRGQISNVENTECTGSQESRGRSLCAAQRENRQTNHAFYASEDGKYEWLAGPDNKFRPIEPGIRLLVNGHPESMGLLHSAGDAIHPEVAAQFISAYLECRP